MIPIEVAGHPGSVVVSTGTPFCLGTRNLSRSRMVGNSYLGIPSGMPVYGPELESWVFLPLWQSMSDLAMKRSLRNRRPIAEVKPVYVYSCESIRGVLRSNSVLSVAVSHFSYFSGGQPRSVTNKR